MSYHFRSKISRDFFSRAQETGERHNKAMEDAQGSLSACLEGYHSAKFGLGDHHHSSIFGGGFHPFDFGFGYGFNFGRLIVGTRGDDTIKGNNKSNYILGLNGDDDIFGRRGNDTIFGNRGDDDINGGRGNDNLFGNRGDDNIKGGRGNDFADGGKGIDTLIFSGKRKHYEIDLDAGTVTDLRKSNKDGTDTFVNIEYLEFKDMTISLIEPEVFTLELLHFADQEANAATIDNIDNLSGVLNALRAEDLGDDGVADNTLTLSSGDAIIPGLFFDASEAVFGSQGIADIQIQNELGVQAIALGNHEFDLGTGLLAGLISGDATGGFTNERIHRHRSGRRRL